MDEIAKAFRNLVRILLSMPENSVRPADQNAPTGTDPYATVKIISVTSYGWDQHKYLPETNPDTVTEVGEGMRRVRFSVQFFRQGAYTKGERLATLLQMDYALARLQAVGLGLVGCSPARDITRFIDTLKEERAQIDVDCHVIVKETVASSPTFEEFPVNIEQ